MLKNRIYAFLLALLFALSSAECCFAEEFTPPYDFFDREHVRSNWRLNLTDIDNDAWYSSVIITAYDWMTGISETKFGPDLNMTRAMFVTALQRYHYQHRDQEETPEKAHFTDIPEDAWYAEAVNWAVANGIAKGVSEERFNPNANITREEIAVMLKKFSEYEGSNSESNVKIPKAYSEFSDVSKVSAWAAESMEWAVNRGFIRGTKIGLEPQALVTRAQVVQLMYNYSMNGNIID